MSDEQSHAGGEQPPPVGGERLQPLPGVASEGAPTPSRSLRGTAVLADPLVQELLAARLVRLPATAVFLGSDDVAIRLLPASAFTWDERASLAAHELRAEGAALPLEPTSPR